MAEVANLPVRRELSAGAPVRAIVPQTMEDAYRVASAVVKAGLAPYGMDTPEKCLVAIMMGMEVGLTPMQSVQRIAVINGRPTIWGDAAIGLVRGSGLCEYVRERFEGKGDDYTAFCEVKRRGEAEPVIGTFSVGDAKRAKLWEKRGNKGQDTPWITHPKRMLQMRARGFALRDAFADVLGGMYLQEELEGVEPMRDVTPPSPPPAPPAAPPAPPPAAMEPMEDAEAEPVIELRTLANPKPEMVSPGDFFERMRTMLEAMDPDKRRQAWDLNGEALDSLENSHPELLEDLQGFMRDDG
ncbi:recombinase RecT [Marinibaculum pumilum]|uniref:Recombinase RecT n=1 Tax=Marinibaculum pumilum TaxID=1766165 RepID=A0ABV7L333_9PROT